MKITAASALPLDHCPISLLNSDHKISSKIPSFRVRPILSHLVLLAQNDFVPKRSLHIALDTFTAVRKVMTLDSDLHKAIVLILECAKLHVAMSISTSCSEMTWLFALNFVSIVASLHRDTNCRFTVSGYLSS